jgi:hypothetical protein
MGTGAPLTPKQKVLVVATAAVLNVPTFIFIFRYSKQFTPREVGVVGLFNLFVGVPLLVLISNKWIRKLR